MLDGGVEQLLSACKPELANGEGAPAKVPAASLPKCLCAVLLCIVLPSRAEMINENLLGKCESKVGWQLLGPAAYYISVG